MAANKKKMFFEQIKGKKRKSTNKWRQQSIITHFCTQKKSNDHIGARDRDGEREEVSEWERFGYELYNSSMCVAWASYWRRVWSSPTRVYRSLISVVTAITFCLISSIFFISFLLLLLICMAHLRKFLYFFIFTSRLLAGLVVASDFCLCRF